MKKYHIRWMIQRDLPEVIAIENASFPYPWNEEDFRHALRQRNCIGMVLEDGCYVHDDYGRSKYVGTGKIIGYMIYTLHKHHLDVLNLAVSPECRHRDVGSALINKLKSKLSSHRRSTISVAIGDRNLDGHLFLRKMDFMCVKVERGHFQETGEDAYIFEYNHPVEEPVLESSMKGEEDES